MSAEMEELQEKLVQMEERAAVDPAYATKVTDIKAKITAMDNDKDGVRTLLSKLLVEKEAFLLQCTGKGKEQVASTRVCNAV